MYNNILPQQLPYMEKTAQNIIFLLVIILSIQFTSSQCQRYNGSACIECIDNYHPDGIKCYPDLVKINERSTHGSQFPDAIQDASGNFQGLVLIRRSQNLNNFSIGNISAKSYEQAKSQLSESAKGDKKDHPTGIAPAGSLNFVQIKEYNQNQPNAPSQVGISLSDIQAFSANSSFIQAVYQNFTLRILENQLVKIALQLFDFELQVTYNKKFDPILTQIMKNMQVNYQKELQQSTFLAAYYRYITFSKIYKVFYVKSSSIKYIEIFEVDAIVDLFHMQILISGFSTYDTIYINESTLSDIKNRTRSH